MYTDFARIYDRLMADVDYDAWSAHYTALLQARGVAQGRVCECACGTGSLTVRLAKQGYEVTGVDLSRDMLSVAVEKGRAWGVNIPFVQQDMCRLALHRPQDAVLATCDGVNYLLTRDRLMRFLRSAHASLRPGGVLAFDVSTPGKLSTQLGSRVLTDSGQDIAYIWQNSYSPATAVVHMALSFFVRRPDGAYMRMEEEQKQRAWQQAELRSALEEAGFGAVRLYGEMGMKPAREKDSRWHVCAAKKKEIP